jgi:hypothetical protein
VVVKGRWSSRSEVEVEDPGQPGTRREARERERERAREREREREREESTKVKMKAKKIHTAYRFHQARRPPLVTAPSFFACREAPSTSTSFVTWETTGVRRGTPTGGIVGQVESVGEGGGEEGEEKEEEVEADNEDRFLLKRPSKPARGDRR